MELMDTITLPNGAEIENQNGKFIVMRRVVFNELYSSDTLADAFKLATTERYIVRNYIEAILCWTGKVYRFIKSEHMIESDVPIVYPSFDSAMEEVRTNPKAYRPDFWIGL